MPSSRKVSPDKYIDMNNPSERNLTSEEKLMVLHVYGNLRKKFGMTVNEAAKRAAILCGITLCTVFHAKNEFDIGNISANLPIKPECDSHASNSNVFPVQTDTGNVSPELYLMAKSKLLDMFKNNPSSTIDSVVTAFGRDSLLVNFGNVAVRNLAQELDNDLTNSEVRSSGFLQEQSLQHPKDVDSQVQNLDETKTAVSSIAMYYQKFDIGDSMDQENGVDHLLELQTLDQSKTDANNRLSMDQTLLFKTTKHDMSSLSEARLHGREDGENSNEDHFIKDVKIEVGTETDLLMNLNVESQAAAVKCEVKSESMLPNSNNDEIFIDGCRTLEMTLDVRESQGEVVQRTQSESVTFKGEPCDRNPHRIFLHVPPELTTQLGLAENNGNCWSRQPLAAQPSRPESNNPSSYSGGSLLMYDTILPFDSSSLSFKDNAKVSKDLQCTVMTSKGQGSDVMSQVTTSASCVHLAFPVSTWAEQTPASGNKHVLMETHPPYFAGQSSSLLQEAGSNSRDSPTNNNPGPSVSTPPLLLSLLRETETRLQDTSHCKSNNALCKETEKHYCTQCKRVYAHKRSFIKHMATHAHPSPSKSPTRGMWTCQYCGNRFDMCKGRGLIQHIMYMHTMKSLKCDFCGLSYRSAHSLVRHVIHFHSESFIQQQGLSQDPSVESLTIPSQT